MMELARSCGASIIIVFEGDSVDKVAVIELSGERSSATTHSVTTSLPLIRPHGYTQLLFLNLTV